MKQRKRIGLFNRNFLLLWQGQFVSNIGSQVFEIAMMLWIKGKTGTASLMGLFLMLSSIADLCCAPLGGVFADRYSRKNIIVTTDTISGICVLVLTLLFIILPQATELKLFFVFITALILGGCMSFFHPAIGAIIPEVVPKKRLSAANSLITGGEQGSLLIGQAIGGLLYSFAGPVFAFFINGSSYLCSAFSETFIKNKKTSVKKSSFSIKNMITQIKQGLHFIWNKQGLRNAALMISVHNFFIIPLLVILPFYLELSLKIGLEWYGFLLAVFSFGNIIGFLIAGIIFFPGKIRKYIILISLSITYICIIIISLFHSIVILLVCIFIAGILGGFSDINIITIIQLVTPANYRGRVFGFLGTLSKALIPVGMGLTGVILDLINKNTNILLFTMGIIALIISCFIFFNKALRNLLAYDIN